MPEVFAESVEAGLFIAAVTAGMLPLLAALFLPGRRLLLVLVAIVLLGAAAAVAVLGRPEVDRELSEAVPEFTPGEGYAESDRCISCHPREHASWHRSFHRTMTQVASPEAVAAPWEGVLAGRGRRIALERRGDQFWFTFTRTGGRSRMPPRLRPGDGRVVMTTGSHHMQVYWVKGLDGGFVEFPWIWSIDQKRWIPTPDSFLRPPEKVVEEGEWLSCPQCHATDYAPRRNPENGRYDFRVTELGIACAACHGPGDEHVRVNQDPLRRYGQYFSAGAGDPTIANPGRMPAPKSTQVCGQCHAFVKPPDKEYSRRHGLTFRPGDDVFDHYVHSRMEGWSDGVDRTGGREFHGVAGSACFEGGELSCLSCHSMHGYVDRADQLNELHARETDRNAACLQCHAEFAADLEAHTHHEPESSGSLCYNCHMPHTSYALLGAIRSHLIDNPRAVSNAVTNRPNACNLCHLDKTLGWTGEKLSEWYGHEQPELTADESRIAASLLWALRGDAAQRGIAAWHMGWAPALEASGSDWLAPFAAGLLQDPYSAVRNMAHRSLEKLPGFEEFDYDFLDPPSRRRGAARRARDHWTGLPVEGAGRAGPEILLRGPRDPVLAEVARLARERDNSPVVIQE